MTAPEPTGASWNEVQLEATVVFDKDLQAAGPFDLANWVLTHSGGTANPTAANVVGGNSMVLGFGVPLSGVTQIEYDPPPFDVIGTNGLEVQAFTEPL